MDSTRTIDDQIMTNHATAVKKAAEKSLVFFDLPYNKEFGDFFIKISRDVHFKNDIRASIKKEINLLSNSNITEEKEYSKY